VIQFAVFAVVLLIVVSLVLYMRAQKSESSLLALLRDERYAALIEEADTRLAANPADHESALLRAQALALIGNHAESERAYRRIVAQSPDDAQAIEGLALSLGHQRRSLDEARALMQRAITNHPQIQEFQSLGLAWIELRDGNRETALRIFEDNRLLIQTRFADDYTDRDPLLVETLYLQHQMLEAAGASAESAEVAQKICSWAPRSWFCEAVRSSAAQPASDSTTMR
jgi:tetratricopeptide (TPR) repeat protein